MANDRPGQAHESIKALPDEAPGKKAAIPGLPHALVGAHRPGDLAGKSIRRPASIR
jgi:hypothetical protein